MFRAVKDMVVTSLSTECGVNVSKQTSLQYTDIVIHLHMEFCTLAFTLASPDTKH